MRVSLSEVKKRVFGGFNPKMRFPTDGELVIPHVSPAFRFGRIFEV